MADSSRPPQPRDYLARRQQWRLLLLVMSLGLVVWAMNTARKPESWTWLLGRPKAGDNALPQGGYAPQPPGESNVPPLLQGLPDDELSRIKSSAGDLPTVDPTALEAIRDDTIFRPEENEAWFGLLAILAQAEASRLERESTGRATFTQLNRQSEEYRGRLVTVRGTVVRAMPAGVAANDLGIEQLYQTVLRPADNPKEVLFVYCLTLPEGFPTGGSVSAEVEATGFFFKRWAYRAEEGILSRPVILARTVRWTPAPPLPSARPLNLGGLIALVAVALCASVAVIVYLSARTRRKPPAEPLEPPTFDVLDELDAREDSKWDNL